MSDSMSSINARKDSGYIIANRQAENKRVNNVNFSGANEAEKTGEHLKAANNFYRGDSSKFSSITGNGPEAFEARKKLVDPLNLVPESAFAGIDTNKANIDGKTIEVGSFNMEWLGCDRMRMVDPRGRPTGETPRTDADYKKMADVIKQSGAEVMGVQEISDEKALKKVLSNLPGYDYVIGNTGIRENGASQRVAIVYNGNKVTCDKSSVTELKEAQVPELAGDGHLRAPLVANFKSKEGGFDFTMVSMHLKAGQKPEMKKIREAQVDVINKWAKDRMANSSEKDLIFVGDFNDTLNSSTTKGLGEGTLLHMTTSESASRNEWSHPVTHRLIDQIGVTTGRGGSLEEYIPGTTGVIRERSSSDHRPVVASFRDVDND